MQQMAQQLGVVNPTALSTHGAATAALPTLGSAAAAGYPYMAQSAAPQAGVTFKSCYAFLLTRNRYSQIHLRITIQIKIPDGAILHSFIFLFFVHFIVLSSDASDWSDTRGFPCSQSPPGSCTADGWSFASCC